MPFVHKDAKGKILAVYTEPVQGAQEVAPNDPALAAFIHDNIPLPTPTTIGLGRTSAWSVSSRT